MEGIRSLKHVHFVLIMVLLLSHGYAGASVIMRCRETEREALLALKQGLVDEYNHLSSWGSREPGKQDCCTWEGVSCSNITGHVIKLDLGSYGHNLQGKISPKLTELQHLRHLDLSRIDFNASKVPDFIGSLTNLRYLSFFSSHFGGPIPNQVGNLTHLEYLDLSYIFFSNAKDLNWLPRLSWLTFLDLSLVNLSDVFYWPQAINQLPKLTCLRLTNCGLPSPSVHSTLVNRNASKSLSSFYLSGNYLSSSIYTWLSNYNTSTVYLELNSNRLTGSVPAVFGNMRSLEHLHLSDNQFEGAEPHSFARLCSLEFLSLRGNNLIGPFSEFSHVLRSACAHKSLNYLDLSWNHLLGSISNLTRFSSLNTLILEGNQLTGRVPESIGEMSKLELIVLGSNSLEGIISETHFSKLSNLGTLDLSYNSLAFNFSPNWIPPFQLEKIDLRSCEIGPYFPNWLRTQKSLGHLDISSAGISDIFPGWFWGLCQNIWFVSISHNQIRGSLANFSTFEPIDMSWNQLDGPIPSFLSKVTILDLSNNRFSGSISSLCTSAATDLIFLDLSSNSFSGEFPKCLKYLENLVVLDLSNNSLSGRIPTNVGALYQMQSLKLSKNKFVGELPSSLKNCTSLVVIDLQYNALSGTIPKWVGDSFQRLVILLLSYNHFKGSMPSQLCRLTHVNIFDVSANNISGMIPKCINNWTSLAQQGNTNSTIKPLAGTSFEYEVEVAVMWKGINYSFKQTLGRVKSIDMSSNRLTGEIPTEIIHLVGLVSLNLSRNQLTGEIPRAIGSLQSLDSLDLSRNQIGGRIPTSLARIDRLGFLDLSYNNLNGKIPTGTQLQGFNSSVYAGNLQLCGLPLRKMCTSEETNPNQQTNHEEKGDDIISRGFYISLAVGFVVGFWGVCGGLIFKRSWRYAYFKFLNDLNDWM